MMKSFKCNFLLIPIFSLVTFAQSATAQNTLLWEISGNKLKSKSYLFGTIHVKDKRVFELGDSVLPKLNSTKVLAVEIVADPAQLMGVIDKLFMKGDTTLEDLLDKKEYNEVSDYLNEKLGAMAPMVNRMKPIFTALTLAQVDMARDEQKILDEAFQDYAKKQGKELKSLESVDEQIKALDKLSYKDQAKELYKTIKNPEKDTKEMSRLVEAYVKEDLYELEQLIKSSEMPSVLNTSLLKERNKVMVERMVALIKEKPTFVAVGAGHLGGNDGLIALLREKGYKVRGIISSKKEKAL